MTAATVARKAASQSFSRSFTLVSPETLAGDAGAFRHRGKLGEHDLRIDRGLPDPGAIPAVGAGDDVLAPDALGVTADALRDHLRMLDEVRFRLDDARDQHLAVRQLDRLEHGELVSVPRIGRFERDRGG